MFSWFRSKKPPREAQKIVPRIKNVDFLATSAELAAKVVGTVSGKSPDSQVPVHEALVGDLVLTFAIDIGPSFMFLNPESIQSFGLERVNLRAAACDAIRSELLESATIHELGNIHVLRAGGNLAACSILFPEMWKRLEAAYGTPLFAGFIHRDFVLFANGSIEEQVESIRYELANAPLEDDNHNLSRVLLVLDGLRWRRVDS